MGSIAEWVVGDDICFILSIWTNNLRYLFFFQLVLVVALEKVEKSSGSLLGSSIASMQKSTAPEVNFETLKC